MAHIFKGNFHPERLLETGRLFGTLENIVGGLKTRVVNFSHSRARREINLREIFPREIRCEKCEKFRPIKILIFDNFLCHFSVQNSTLGYRITVFSFLKDSC